MKLWNTIRDMFKPLPFSPIPSPEDLVCTHEGSSSCAIQSIKVTSMPQDDWLAMVLGESKDPRTDVMSFDHGGETVWPK